MVKRGRGLEVSVDVSIVHWVVGPHWHQSHPCSKGSHDTCEPCIAPHGPIKVPAPHTLVIEVWVRRLSTSARLVTSSCSSQVATGPGSVGIYVFIHKILPAGRCRTWACTLQPLVTHLSCFTSTTLSLNWARPPAHRPGARYAGITYDFISLNIL